jgi:hypothetical protein
MATAAEGELTAQAVPAAGRRPKRRGPLAAAVLAVAAGQAMMGLVSLLNQYLNPEEWIPIPGVTPFPELEGGTRMILMWSNYAVMTGLCVLTALAWLITWAIAYEVLGKRRTVGRRVYWAAGILFGAGLLCSFTPFYNWLLPG